MLLTKQFLSIKTILVCIVFVVSFISCGETNSNSVDNSENSLKNISEFVENETETEIEVEEEVTVEVSKEMDKYFTEEQKKYLTEVNKKFLKIKTSKDVAEFYAEKDKIDRTVSDAMYKHDPDGYDYKKWDFLKVFMPGLCVGDGAEGIMIAKFSLVPLYEKAKQTPEKDDDLFFEAISEGGKTEDGDNEIKYLKHAWLHYCYHDLEPCYLKLGKGEIYNYLLRIEKALNVKGNFKKELDDMMSWAITELKCELYAYSKEDTQKYIDKIAEDIKLEGDLLTTFNEAKTYIAALPDEKFNTEEKWNKGEGPF